MEAHFKVVRFKGEDPQPVLEQIRLFMSAQESLGGDVLYGNDATDSMVLTEIKNGVPRSSTAVVASEIWSILNSWLSSIFSGYTKSTELSWWDVYVIIGETPNEGNLIQLKSKDIDLVYELAITHVVEPENFKLQVR